MSMTSNLPKIFLCIAAALALAACANRKAAEKTEAVDSQDMLSVRDATPPGDAGEARDVPARAVVYFDFDSSDIRPEFRQSLLQQVQSLGSDARLGFRLEGHTDSRGSREYNIGLGERRAQAVRQFLTLNGASQMQLTTVSYGEERPATQGDTEDAWRMNRRVELVPFTR